MARIKPVFIILVFLLFACPSCKKENFHEKQELMLDTLVSIKIPDMKSRDEEAIIRDLFSIIAKQNKYVDRYTRDGELTYVNSNACTHPVFVSAGLFGLLTESLEYCRQYEGYFDITVAPLVDLWGFGTSQDTSHSGRPPAREDILKALLHIGYLNVTADTGTKTVHLKNAAQLDLGAVSKGFILRGVDSYLSDKGIKDIIINAGGEVLAKGKKGKKKPWNIGIKHPRRQGELCGTLEVTDCTVSTSGDYERYFEYGGRKFFHIINPVTGYPSFGCISVTIIVRDPLLADALSTAVFVMGPEKGAQYLQASGKAEGIIIWEDLGEEGEYIGLKSYVSPSLKGRVKLTL